MAGLSQSVRRMLGSVRSRLTRPISFFRWSVNWWRVWGTLPITTWIRGADYFKKGDYRQAATAYHKGLVKYPTHKAAYCARLDYAYCLYRIGEFGQAAIELSRMTLTKNPIRDAFLLFSRIQLITGDFRGAVSTLRRGVQTFPKDIQMITSYAHATHTAKEMVRERDEARMLLERVRLGLNLSDPLLVAVDGAIAAYELRFGDQPRGEQLLTRVIASGSAPYEAILLRGELMIEEGLVLPGRGLLTRAMTLAPYDPRPVAALAKSYLLEGDYFEPDYALQLASSACSLSRYQNAECVALLVESHLAMGDEVTAELMTQRLRSITSAKQLNIGEIHEASAQIQRLRLAKA